jgi:DNA-3-methyladenine glycosylase I
MAAYHDEEWGVPLRDDRALFELLTLEGAQAGLSWSTILQRREGYRRAFVRFDPVRVAGFDDRDIERLLSDGGIIRNRQKIVSTITNAREVLTVQQEYGSFDRYVWSFVDGKTIDHLFTSMDQIPATTEESVRLSKALRKRGFGFVGPTICYAFMQSAGLVNDHLSGCPARMRILALSASEKR